MSDLTRAQKKALHHCPDCGHLIASHDGSGCSPCLNTWEDGGGTCEADSRTIETTYAAVAALLPTALDDLEAWLVDRIARAERAEARIHATIARPLSGHSHNANVTRLGRVTVRQFQLRDALAVVREWRDQ
jgi:hypothetical protein